MWQPVKEFNEKRNGLELKPELEVAMLQEEVKEFWDAKTFAERVDAFIDTRYVWMGTQMKYSKNMSNIPEDLEKWVDSSISLMFSLLVQECGSEDAFNHIIGKAEKIVCDINAIKVSQLDENGKVIKQENLPNATNQIADMIEKLMKLAG